MNELMNHLQEVKQQAGKIGGLTLDEEAAEQLFTDYQSLYSELKELRRINKEWQQVTQPAFDYVDSKEIGQIGKSKIGALIESHKALAAHVEKLKGLFGDFENDANDNRMGWSKATLDILRSTPKASLADHNANVINQFAEWIKRETRFDITGIADGYNSANKICKGKDGD